MKQLFLIFLSSMTFVTAPVISHAQGGIDAFKKALNETLLQLIPSGYDKRVVKFVSVKQGANTGNIQNFKVTAFIHDYDAGYPPNQYYGTTCLSKMEDWLFKMEKDPFGEYVVRGSFIVTNDAHYKCESNTLEGVASIPIESVPGSEYDPKKTASTTTKVPEQSTGNGDLYIGQYACYGTGGRLMTGMGFILLKTGTYYDLDKRRGGTYIYDRTAGTIKFKGGFLDGQKGTNVSADGFQLSNTVNAEPWK